MIKCYDKEMLISGDWHQKAPYPLGGVVHEK